MCVANECGDGVITDGEDCDGAELGGADCTTLDFVHPDGLGCTASEALADCQAARCCSPYCDLSEPDPCMAPEQCEPYYEPGTAPPGFSEPRNTMMPSCAFSSREPL